MCRIGQKHCDRNVHKMPMKFSMLSFKKAQGQSPSYDQQSEILSCLIKNSHIRLMKRELTSLQSKENIYSCGSK